MRFCIACRTPLRGRQTKWCSDRCKKRVQRHPERYPELQPGTGGVQVRKRGLASVFEAASTNEALATYQALRDRLALEIDESDQPRDVAILSARLADVVEKIDLLTDVEKEGSALDELRQRRRERAG